MKNDVAELPVSHHRSDVEGTICQGCSLGLEVSVSRPSRDLFFEGLGLVSVSGNFGGSRSRSRLGLKIKRLGLVSVSKLNVSFTSEIFLTAKFLILKNVKLRRSSHNNNLPAEKANVGYIFIPTDTSAECECLT